MRLKLPPFYDVTRFLVDSFRNEVFVTTDEEFIKCSGAVLAARSSVIEGKIEKSENIPATEFSGDIPDLNSCLDVLYGDSVILDVANYRNIYKFGKLFEIQEMMDCVLTWVSKEVQCDILWDVLRELKRIGGSLSSEQFKDIIRRCSSVDFWQNTKKVCLEKNGDAVKDVFKILPGTDVFSPEDVLRFVTDILDVIKSRKDIPSYSTSENSGVTSMVLYLENKMTLDLVCSSSLYSEYSNILKKLSSVCNDVESLHKICNMQSNVINSMTLLLKEVALSMPSSLNRELVEKLIRPSTPCDTIRHFIQNVDKDVHQCAIGDIVLEWWRVSRTECHDMAFIETLFKNILIDVWNTWVFDASLDNRYEGLFRKLKLGKIACLKVIWYDCTHNKNLIALKRCIEKGDGTDFILPKKDLYTSEDMVEYKINKPVFRYNAALFPPYGAIAGYWYMEFSSGSTDRKVSLITESQQDILGYFESCDGVVLCFIPSPKSRQKTSEKKNTD